MKLRGVFLCLLAISLFITACAHHRVAQPTKASVAPAVVPPVVAPTPPPPAAPAVATAPVYVPSYAHAGDPLPEHVLVWNTLLEITNATADQDFARFVFDFTNVTSTNVTILRVRPSCGCTTAELPPVPWTITPGASGEIKLKVDLAGKFGTIFKTAKVTTDKGNKDLVLRINILPAAPVKMTAAQRAAGVAKAKVDRQAVFKGDCASCHSRNAPGKYGLQLYNVVCGICHEAKPRATMVPDLSKLTVPTNVAFWRTWISYGKPGTLMPAFAASQGGPLTDLQIASLAAYLNSSHPSHVPAQ